MSWGQMGSSWVSLGRLGGVLGASWARLGASWARLGASWGRLGAVLGASWGRPGVSLGRLGSILGRFGSQRDASQLGPHFGIDFCLIFVPMSTPENLKNIDFSLVFQGFLKKLPLGVNIDV